jgi:hypothetical protein
MEHPIKEPDTHSSVAEIGTFWKEQIDEFHKTTLSCRAYCRERHLNYHHFLYRYRKLKLAQKKDVLKAIPVQVSAMPALHKSQLGLCRFEFSSGQQLMVYDPTVLSLLLERLL